jgi:hypothetical protein
LTLTALEQRHGLGRPGLHGGDDALFDRGEPLRLKGDEWEKWEEREEVAHSA